MIVGVMRVKLYAPYIHSLKEKRMEVKSLTAKVGNKFNVSVAEVDAQNLHQTIIIAIALVFSDGMTPDSVWDCILNFIEANTEAEITEVSREIR
ncbi:MAG: hypothetical protein BWY15_00797 [Firmicutes bacterium ADurb.Bin193]|nr:MAG: hypothetical protein BWY15_00797 [Firmicutes bacterium ADurb.Bin193]